MNRRLIKQVNRLPGLLVYRMMTPLPERLSAKFHSCGNSASRPTVHCFFFRTILPPLVLSSNIPAAWRRYSYLLVPRVSERGKLSNELFPWRTSSVLNSVVSALDLTASQKPVSHASLSWACGATWPFAVSPLASVTKPGRACGGSWIRSSEGQKYSSGTLSNRTLS